MQKKYIFSLCLLSIISISFSVLGVSELQPPIAAPEAPANVIVVWSQDRKTSELTDQLGNKYSFNWFPEGGGFTVTSDVFEYKKKNTTLYSTVVGLLGFSS